MGCCLTSKQCRPRRVVLLQYLVACYDDGHDDNDGYADNDDDDNDACYDDVNLPRYPQTIATMFDMTSFRWSRASARTELLSRPKQ